MIIGEKSPLVNVLGRRIFTFQASDTQQLPLLLPELLLAELSGSKLTSQSDT
jgi:hypothetical protein